ncbi:hypothetical protein [Sinomicrobium weinanense]|uniref:Uncharacterized protein n=1 Tax=Sinomicrobium weinanense TaxID=2842200 RepID=A0A926JSV4_9FLAO|nr:hypothetical protein [Sinomicrobium weinanense]MBC9796632.1 hypothetical protein [Sinomicrobium weinanense]MBU3123844.1 hypothetical protein [Sinomicrobium weinanense]
MYFYYGTLILSNSLLIIAFLLGGAKLSALHKEGKWYICYLGFIVGVELLTEILILAYVQNTGFIYPFYAGGEFFLLISMFVVAQRLSYKWYIPIGLITIFIFVEAATLWFNNQNVTAGYGKVFSHLSIACFAGYTLIRGLRHFEKENRFLTIYGCLFLYYLSSLFLFLLLHQLTDLNPQSASVVWGMNNILSSVLYGVSCYIFLRLKK